MKWIFFTAVFSFFLIGCKKNSDLNKNLFGCPVNYDCTYNYQENSDFSSNFSVIGGNYRLFDSHFVQKDLCDNATDYFFKAPMGNGSFTITDAEIASGNSVYYSSFCTCCSALANVHPLGGEIKGTKIDANRWLLNNKIILGISKDRPLDTIIFNQYYSIK